MAIPKRKSLAGTNGIPLEKDRTYADTVTLGSFSNSAVERGSVGKVTFPGGRTWDVESILHKREFGRELFGNLVVHYSLRVGGSERDLWWEGGRWFSRKGA